MIEMEESIVDSWWIVGSIGVPSYFTNSDSVCKFKIIKNYALFIERDNILLEKCIKKLAIFIKRAEGFEGEVCKKAWVIILERS